MKKKGFEMKKQIEITLAMITSYSLAEKLHNARKARGLSMSELSEKCGIHRNTIAAIESGENILSASVKTLMAISKALECEFVTDLRPYEEYTQEDTAVLPELSLYDKTCKECNSPFWAARKKDNVCPECQAGKAAE
jgi:transcriptional regulator with XRE-family HTH domain